MLELLVGAQTEYEGQSFENLDLARAELGFKEFYDCVFTACSFLEAVFKECRFVDCKFNDCDLSLCRVEGCSFSGIAFKNSQLIGINWTEASWPERGFLSTVGFEDCAINHSTLIGLSLRELRLTGCSARNVDFSEADLSRATCTHTDFEGSRFVGTNLTEADLTGATNYAINANLSVLKKTKFRLPEAMSLLYSLDIILIE